MIVPAFAAALASCKTRTDEAAPAIARPIERADELLWGPAATGAIGDIMIENGLILAVITNDAATSGFAASEGNLVDLAPLPDGEDHINELFLYLDNEFPRQARYDEVEIVKRGGGKREARVRAKGHDTGNPKIRVETDYVLRPGQHWLTIETRFTTTATYTIASYEIGDAVQWGRTEHMAPGHGFDLPGKRVDVDWICGIGQDTSYALVPDGSHRFDTFNGSMWSDPIGATVTLEPKKTVTYVRHFVVGRGDTASLAPAVAQLRGDPTGRFTGRVTHDGTGVRDARVWFMDQSDKIAGLARVDRDGWYSIDLKAGEYHARADAPGRTSVDAGRGLKKLTAGETASVHFEMGPQGILAWRIRGHDGRAPPVRVTVTGSGDTPNPRFGPAFRASGAEHFVLSARGVGQVPISAGTYRVVVSRGPEYELIQQDVTIEPGRREEVTGTMTRAFETPGFVSSDLHQHSAPSFDSGVSLADRALSNAAEGVEVLVSTEHNFITDYRPVVAEAGLGRVVYPIAGTEATTHSVGHFNGFPLIPNPGKPRGGMVDVEGRSPRQIFDFMRRLAPKEIDPFIQVNHPRSGLTGYFDMMKVDEKTGIAKDPRYVADFNGMETIAFGIPKETTEAMRDWFNLLRRGHRYTATGNSDSHTITLRPVGWPRTYVCVDQDDPPLLDVAAFTKALRDGCATISAGPFVTIQAGDTRMGGLATAPNGESEVTVEVSAASWIPTDRLVLYVDGVPTEEVAITEKGTKRYRGTHHVHCKRDCSVVAYVDAAGTLEPVIQKRRKLDPKPIAMTNPIYFDVDGDGAFAPSKQ